MAIEIEKKYRLTHEQNESAIDSLHDLKAVYTGEDHEENVIYGGEILEVDHAVVRIRTTKERSFITYKKRIVSDSSAKQQIEYESEVGDPGEIAEILRCIGLEPRLVYEKRRKKWRFDEVEIVLDELPFGLYMEIEGPIVAIAKAEMLLGIDGLVPEAATYPQLTIRYGRPNNGLIEARFGA